MQFCGRKQLVDVSSGPEIKTSPSNTKRWGFNLWSEEAQDPRCHGPQIYIHTHTHIYVTNLKDFKYGPCQKKILKIKNQFSTPKCTLNSNMTLDWSTLNISATAQGCHPWHYGESLPNPEPPPLALLCTAS